MCNKVDNNCREEKRGCQGCYYKRLKKNIEFWENESQKELKANNIAKATFCKILANKLREEMED